MDMEALLSGDTPVPAMKRHLPERGVPRVYWNAFAAFLVLNVRR
jgi:hypothetical protein